MTSNSTNVSQEKQKIIDCTGNILVTANPGTGKTFFLAHKYARLLKQGLKPEEILCLTFTNKAKTEMSDRIVKTLKDKGVQMNMARIQVHTFHSYAMNNLDEIDIISSNFTRYSIYRYYKKNQILNYGDEYLITLASQFENLVAYMKSYGILPYEINTEETKLAIEPTKTFEKRDLERFLENFINLFKYYEEAKKGKGIDYADLLINFFKQNHIKKYKYVLIDELQDVNNLEAEIALKSCENFVAVGDKKQAIFGFQGGSISNFQKFKNSTQFILTENFRSTNEILNYVKFYFTTNTKEVFYKEELKNLQNKEAIEKAENKQKPRIYETPKEDIYKAACDLAIKLLKKAGDKEKVAIIARTNNQIFELSEELKNRGFKYSSTFLSASSIAKKDIIDFLTGLLSEDIQDIKSAMFTPFFPLSLKDAFKLAGKKDFNLDLVFQECPKFKEQREMLKSPKDLGNVFEKIILPIAVSNGEEFLLSSIALWNSCYEALKIIEDKTLQDFISYLQSSDIDKKELESEEKLVLTTLHKAKGKEYTYVIYIPAKTKDSATIQDIVVEAILKSKGVYTKEEIEEEFLRIDFVAMTRAEKELHIITDNPQKYLNEYSEKGQVDLNETTNNEEKSDFARERKAYALFVNGKYEKAKELLQSRGLWLKEFIKNHFSAVDRISYSALTDKPFKYLKSNILGLRHVSTELNLGKEVHEIARKIISKEECVVSPDAKSYVENIKKLLNQINAKYPLALKPEQSLSVPLKNLVEKSTNINFSGKIDAVFRNEKQEYLIVDWKTDKRDNYGAEHRQQLELYKRAYSIQYQIPLENIRVAIGYVGLKNTINDGVIREGLDETQPSNKSFETVLKKINLFLSWKNDTNKFLHDLIEFNDSTPEGALVEAVKEEALRELYRAEKESEPTEEEKKQSASK